VVDDTLIVCDAAPPSDQFSNAYCTPLLLDCVDADIVWVDPDSHENEHGEMHAV
jgi:hypothetical protein